MDGKLNPESIRQLLNRSVAQLDQATHSSLRAARLRALSRYETRRATSSLFAWDVVHVNGHATVPHHGFNYWMGVMLLAVGLFSGIVCWQQAMDNDVGDMDIAILTDDLPIQYYVD